MVFIGSFNLLVLVFKMKISNFIQKLFDITIIQSQIYFYNDYFRKKLVFMTYYYKLIIKKLKVYLR